MAYVRGVALTLRTVSYRADASSVPRFSARISRLSPVSRLDPLLHLLVHYPSDYSQLKSRTLTASRTNKSPKLYQLSKQETCLFHATLSYPAIMSSLYGKVVVLYSSLNTCDPGDVHETIAKLKSHKVRASVIGLGAEMVSE